MPIKTFIFIIFSLSFNSSFTVAIAQERPSSDIPTVQNKSSLTNSRPDEEKSLVLRICRKQTYIFLVVGAHIRHFLDWGIYSGQLLLLEIKKNGPSSFGLF